MHFFIQKYKNVLRFVTSLDGVWVHVEFEFMPNVNASKNWERKLKSNSFKRSIFLDFFGQEAAANEGVEKSLHIRFCLIVLAETLKVERLLFLFIRLISTFVHERDISE